MPGDQTSKSAIATITVTDIGSFTVSIGLNLRETLRREGIYIDGTCADQGKCGRCVVRILSGKTNTPSPQEKGILGEGSIGSNERLACRITVQDNMEVSIAGERILKIEKAGLWKEVWDSPLWLPASYPLTGEGFGIALDLGTTSLAVALYDLATGRPIDLTSAANPQMTWGDEIISRLDAVAKEPDIADTLRDILWEKVQNLVRTLCLRSGISPGRITRGVAVGNSAINHLALGLPVQSLLTPPYAPCDPESKDLRASDSLLGLKLNGNARIYFPPLIGGYAGSDALVSLLAVRSREVRRGALVDVGTNTEITIWDGDRYILATAPSGPAFEGGHIRSGMRAVEGAISKVKLTDQYVDTEVIGGGQAKGICGTGIVDAVAEMLTRDLIDGSGLMRKGSHPRLTDEGLVLDESSRVTLQPEDIATVQKAKAAIAATVDVLLGRLNMRAQDLDEVFLAGAFGSRLNPGNAFSIGLLPPIRPERFMAVGNAALLGASLVLLSDIAREEMERLVQAVEHISVAEDARFEELFLDNLYFRKVPEQES